MCESKKELEKVTKKDYPLWLAGKQWSLDHIEFVKEDDQLSISGSEGQIVNRSVANAIIGNGDFLTQEELYFLCEVADIDLSDVAKQVYRTRNEILQEIERTSDIQLSYRVKKLFWDILFGTNGQKELEALSERALKEGKARKARRC